MKGRSRVFAAVLGITFLLGILHDTSTLVSELAVMDELPFVYESIGVTIVLYLNLVAVLTFLCEPVLALYLGYRTEQDGTFAGYGGLVKTVAVASLVGFSVGRALLFAVLPASVVPVSLLSAEFLLVVVTAAVGMTIEFAIAVLAGTALAHFRTGQTPEQRETGVEAGL